MFSRPKVSKYMFVKSGGSRPFYVKIEERLLQEPISQTLEYLRGYFTPQYADVSIAELSLSTASSDPLPLNKKLFEVLRTAGETEDNPLILSLTPRTKTVLVCIQGVSTSECFKSNQDLKDSLNKNAANALFDPTNSVDVLNYSDLVHGELYQLRETKTIYIGVDNEFLLFNFKTQNDFDKTLRKLKVIGLALHAGGDLTQYISKQEDLQSLRRYVVVRETNSLDKWVDNAMKAMEHEALLALISEIEPVLQDNFPQLDTQVVTKATVFTDRSSDKISQEWDGILHALGPDILFLLECKHSLHFSDINKVIKKMDQFYEILSTSTYAEQRLPANHRRLFKNDYKRLQPVVCAQAFDNDAIDLKQAAEEKGLLVLILTGNRYKLNTTWVLKSTS
jgi:hypothetical protein